MYPTVTSSTAYPPPYGYAPMPPHGPPMAVPDIAKPESYDHGSAIDPALGDGAHGGAGSAGADSHRSMYPG